MSCMYQFSFYFSIGSVGPRNWDSYDKWEFDIPPEVMKDSLNFCFVEMFLQFEMLESDV